MLHRSFALPLVLPGILIGLGLPFWGANADVNVSNVIGDCVARVGACIHMAERRSGYRYQRPPECVGEITWGSTAVGLKFIMEVCGREVLNRCEELNEKSGMQKCLEAARHQISRAEGCVAFLDEWEDKHKKWKKCFSEDLE